MLDWLVFSASATSVSVRPSQNDCSISRCCSAGKAPTAPRKSPFERCVPLTLAADEEAKAGCLEVVFSFSQESLATDAVHISIPCDNAKGNESSSDNNQRPR